MDDMSGFDCLGADVVGAAKSSQALTSAIVAYGAGTVLGTVGGALLWRAHRVGGALLGFFLVGPMIGLGIAAAALPKK